ncbi:hydrolase 1, exosortase A system-associated [Sphingomonas montana]|uniref:hydrolase 1, exosortase A system-associated n=1 Tax=Sphingomonas montana TaxID=1843236 RepID=UPI00096E645B|nr:hydrolase 1, exosortase A system-associated [Sphingomonas montana]
MREFLNFDCAGDAIAATLDTGMDAAAAPAGLLIVGGGTEIRSGAHGGMAQLAAAVAAAGWPVLRYDRRGVGDSAGADPGFADSGPDITVAADTLRARLAPGARVIGFGLCDGATALALHHHAARVDGLLLANPWVVEPVGDLPPPAAVRAHYLARLTDWRFWKRALTGGVDLRKAARGVASLGAATDDSLPARIAGALLTGRRPLAILLAKGDATAIAFDDAWGGKSFAAIRDDVEVVRIDSPSHTFAAGDAAMLAAFVVAGLERFSS